MSGIDRIAAERQRQMDREGWTAQHDDKEHRHGELTQAALCYLTGNKAGWPREMSWWKPGNRMRDLEKAGALIAAEIDRMERAGEVSEPAPDSAVKVGALEFDLKAAQGLLAFFGGEDTLVSVDNGPDGLVAWPSEYPEEGSIVLRAASPDSKVDVGREPAVTREGALVLGKYSEEFAHAQASVSPEEHRILLQIHGGYIEYGAVMYQRGREEVKAELAVAQGASEKGREAQPPADVVEQMLAAAIEMAELNEIPAKVTIQRWRSELLKRGDVPKERQ